MYIPKKMQINRFVDVAIPTNKSYFDRLGQVSLPESSYTGDEVAPIARDKMQSIQDYEDFAKSMDDKSSDDSRTP